ncbi:MAG: hypothetical protein ACYDCH_08100 [Gaiellaceae bacterium]
MDHDRRAREREREHTLQHGVPLRERIRERTAGFARPRADLQGGAVVEPGRAASVSSGSPATVDLDERLRARALVETVDVLGLIQPPRSSSTTRSTLIAAS